MKSDTYGSVADVEPIQATQLVEVEAPSNLPEGFKFNSVYEGVMFPVIVPAGGVVKGQKIVVPFDPNVAATSTAGPAWKDSLCNCCTFGCIHPSIVNAAFCPLILLGQIMTRLQLDYLARPSSQEQWSQTYNTMVGLTVIYFICALFFPDSDFFSLVNFLYTVFVIVTVVSVRQYLRARDGIPETNCVGCEDLCCGLCCACCSTSQMARQTANYDAQNAAFFTNDGIQSPPAESVMVV